MSRVDETKPTSAPWLSGDMVDYDLEDLYQNTSLDMAGGPDSIQATWPEYQVGRIFWEYGAPLVIITGTIGSILSLLVLCRKSMRNKTTMFYLASLAVSDLTCLYTGLLRLWLEHAQSVYIRLSSNTSCKLHTFVVYVSLDFSAWILVAVSVDRCLFVTWPHRAKTWCTIRNARLGVAAVAAAVTLVNLHFFWTYQLEGDSVQHIYGNEGARCYADTSSAFTVRFVETVWPWIDFCFYCLFPFVFMLACDVIITRQLLRSDRAMASHKRRLFFRRRRLTSRFKPPEVTGARLDRGDTGVQCATPRRPERHAGAAAGGGGGVVVSASAAGLRGIDRGSIRPGSDGALMTLSVLQHHETHSGHNSVPAYLTAPNLANDGDASGDFDHVELHAAELSAIYISKAAQHTPPDLTPQHNGVNYDPVNSVTPLEYLTFRRENNNSESQPSLNGSADLTLKERLRNKHKVSPIKLTSAPNCADVKLKDAVSPSNVNASFTFQADDDDVLLVENVQMRKKKTAHGSDIRRRFSCKVHPVEIESDLAEPRACSPQGNNSDEEIPEVNLDTSIQSKRRKDGQCMNEAFEEDSSDCNQKTENRTSARNNRTSNEECTCILLEGGNDSNRSKISKPVNQKIRRVPKKEEITSDNSNRNSSISSDTLQTSRRTTASVSKTLLAVTATFWLLNAPIVIFIIGYTYWAQIVDERKRARLTLAWAVVNFLQYLNNAIHFFLYCLTGPRFRQELIALFRCGKKSSTSR